MEQRRRRKRSPILVFDLLLTGRVGLEFWLFGSSRVFTEMKKKNKKSKILFQSQTFYTGRDLLFFLRFFNFGDTTWTKLF